jgi:formylglycine-generating enzyme required for sulfatase activity
MNDNPSHFKDATNAGQLPVENVSWNTCQNFCHQLNQRLPGLALSLPTEAQWEYACRAGSQRPFATSAQLTTAQANYDGSYPYNNGPQGETRAHTVAVDEFAPNRWGLVQMHGNVWEWCQDSWGDYQSTPEIDSLNKEQSEQPQCVVRGGSWFSLARYCRSAFRYRCHYDSGHDFAGDGIGLRVTQVEPVSE